MTKIKLCGLTRLYDIQSANLAMPDYIGFVFAPKSSRYVTGEQAAKLKKYLNPAIRTVGVFADQSPELAASLLNSGTIDLAQLHGHEDYTYIRSLRSLTDKPLIQAFRIDSRSDIEAAAKSPADYILLDSGQGGTGIPFDWTIIKPLDRPYFLAGGLDTGNAGDAVSALHPYCVDVSSGIETNGLKNREKITEFVRAVRTADRKD